MDKITSWEAFNRSVYWDRKVDLEQWRAGIANAIPNYLYPVLMWAKVEDFMYHYTPEQFIADWPRLLATLPANEKRHSRPFNEAWQALVPNAPELLPEDQMPPAEPDWATLAFRSAGKKQP